MYEELQELTLGGDGEELEIKELTLGGDGKKLRGITGANPWR